MTRVVFDTNVIVSAVLFSDSVPDRAFLDVLDSGTILMSRSLARELSEMLDRDKFDRYVSREQRGRFLASLIRESDMIEVTESLRVCRDPKDNRILELTIDGNADCIVTGDADLLVLNPFRGVRILTSPRSGCQRRDDWCRTPECLKRWVDQAR